MDKETRLDLVLHPVRIRIILALSGRQLSPLELLEELGDVPQATLYRHINRLVEGGLLEVVAERQVRNAIERVYTLKPGAARAGKEEAASLSREAHLQYFVSFLLTLLDDFSRFLRTADLPADLDQAGYQKLPLYLDPAEFTEFSRSLNQALLPYLKHMPREGRRRFLLAFLTLPDTVPQA